jgi:hypothetical protein
LIIGNGHASHPFQQRTLAGRDGFAATTRSGVRIPVRPPSEVLFQVVFPSSAQFHKMEKLEANFSNAFTNAITEVVAELV